MFGHVFPRQNSGIYIIKNQFWVRGGDFRRFLARDPSFPLKYEKCNFFKVFPCKNMFI